MNKFLSYNEVFSITEDKSGNLWFGTSGGGVSKYDGKSFTNYTTAQGLANNEVFSITEDKSGNLWFGTEGGGVSVHRFAAVAGALEGEAAAKLRNVPNFTNFTTADGLPDDFVTQVTEGNDGQLYIGTNFGICELIPRRTSLRGAERSGVTKQSASDDEIASPPLADRNDGGEKTGNDEWVVGSVYNSATGFPVKDVNAGQNGMFKDSKGIIWIATGASKTALVRFDPSAVHKNSNPPTVVLQSVRIQGENICWYAISRKSQVVSSKSKKENNTYDLRLTTYDSTIVAQQEIMTYGKLLSNELRDSITKKFSDIQFDGITKFYPLPENLILPYNHNSVSFEFNAIETGKNFLVRYQYILEGYDKEWSPITEKTSATFGNIYEGTYTFKLKARSPEGVWSEPIEYKFKVLPPWYRHWLAYLFYFLLLASFIFVIVWWNGRKLRERAKELLEKVRIATAEIREQKEVVEEQKKVVEEQKKVVELVHEKLAAHHKEITDSIRYAQRIQHSILPSPGALNAALKDGFLLYLPKDVVAGDFYWMESKGDTVYFAAADCTGHGVPGAMVSVVCSYALSKTLLEENINETGKLLDRTRELVIERFAKSEEDIKDGMDISLCALNMKTLKLQWSGANNPLWIISKGELTKYQPDKQPIGKQDDPSPFATHNIQLENDDMLYIFSDGYHDQFGGPRGKRFMRKRMEELIMTNSHKTTDEQKEILQKSFEEWKGGLEQVDDVCIIGVKV